MNRKPKMIKCPGCTLELPENDLHAQMAHMDREHSNIIASRRASMPSASDFD